eukprot:TRINITY_DN10652_c0_g1_i2.p1 TRINITY_DN10652_c0_g1~~TRINITY_DN10652_c0_g1_i2.p1  ORF type:complete len:334 (-),score=60.07 TRINITY_DN10652_c0_g1_i2:74-1075(-)
MSLQVNAITDDRPKLLLHKEVNVEEFFEEPSTLQKKVKTLAQLLKDSKHCVVFTGAGVSTSASLPDYRGPKGLWTLASQRQAPAEKIDLTAAKPTFSHVALTLLERKGFIKFLVSTNIDGLHMKSGFPVEKLSELHGNCFVEKCSICGKRYLRDFDVTENKIYFPDTPVESHWTGRLCEDSTCGGKLIDTVVRFGEFLPDEHFQKGAEQSWKADLSLVLGSSLRVSPANRLPLYAAEKNNGNLVICNLQQTPFADISLNIHAMTDDVMFLLMKELGLDIGRDDLLVGCDADVLSKYDSLKKPPPNVKSVKTGSRELILGDIKAFSGGLKHAKK